MVLLFSVVASFLLLSIALGVVGLFASDMDEGLLPGSIFNVIQMCMMESEYPAAGNIILRIAVWLCPLSWLIFAATSLVFLRSWLEELAVAFSIRFGKHRTAIQGDDELCQMLCDELGEDTTLYLPESIASRSAPRQILFFRSSRNLLVYISENRERLENKKVYVITETLRPTSLENRSIVYIYLPETVAENYWLDNPIPPSHKGEKVAIIGFGRFGEEILRSALRMEVYAPDDGFEYHVFPLEGEGDGFFLEHWNLGELAVIGDGDLPEWKSRIVLHAPGNGWKKEIHEQQFDRIIIAPDSDCATFELLHDAKLIADPACLHIRSSLADPNSGYLYEGRGRELWFGSFRSSFNPSGHSERLREDAMVVNWLYNEFFHVHEPSSGSEVDGIIADWSVLSTKHKRSNISAALHVGSKRLLLEELGASGSLAPAIAAYAEDVSARSDECLDFALKVLRRIGGAAVDASSISTAVDGIIKGEERARLLSIASALLDAEHIRWARDYWLDNWRLGSRKDSALREHDCLVPCTQLPEEVRMKDWLGYLVILEELDEADRMKLRENF